MQQLLNQIAEISGYLWQKGWGERNGGNLTVNVTRFFLDDEGEVVFPEYVLDKYGIQSDDTDEYMMFSDWYPLGTAMPYIADQYFYVKGTQKRMRDMARDPMANGCIILISPDGTKYTYVSKRVPPTSELPSHLMVQNYLRQSGSRYTATLHTHPIELVALSHHRELLDDNTRPNRLTRTLWSMIPETLAFAPLGLGIVPYEIPGSKELAEATLERIRDYDVVLWEKHGVFAVGQDIIDAFDQVDVLNKAARIYLDALAYTAAYPESQPEGMTAEAMQTVQQVFHLPTRRPC